ncbi:hypothetical protein KPL74_01895 [Bacillus sp. NP157]|nr:hypothetical protein KPL74_01895 [Bacillus sp. NP157]
MFNRFVFFLTTGLWTWLARVCFGDLGTDWVFDEKNPKQSQQWMFGAMEDRAYATREMLDKPDGQRAIVTFNRFRAGLFDASGAAITVAAATVTIVAFAQGFIFGLEG